MAYISVSLWVVMVGPPGMVLAILFKWPEILYLLGRIGVRIGLRIVGIRYRVFGKENIQCHRASVYCVNHSSNVEPPILYMALSVLHPGLKILYKAEIHRLPVLSRAFDIVGFVPIERQNREQSSGALEKAAASLRAGNSFLIFPEGTRSLTGSLQRFKKGGFIMAIKGRAPIIPVAIQGTRAAMSKGSLVMRPVTVNVRLGKPVELNGEDLDQRDQLMLETRSRVEELLFNRPVSDRED
tara:strand:- start:3524 stop:4243 length:720 start_codon:yes stop_codon:yes gene_type:complete